MKHKEHDLQVACVKWFRLQYPDYLIYAIPNGGARTPTQGAILKREGVVAGIPDLHIPIHNHIYKSLYIELKVGKNKPTAAQLAIHETLEKHWNKVTVCYCLDDFIQTVKQYFNG